MGGASCRSTMVACAPNDGQTAVPFYAQRIPVQQRRALGFVRHARRRGHGRWRAPHRRAALVLVACRHRGRSRRARAGCSTGAAAGRGAVAVGAAPPALAAAARLASDARLHRTPSRVRLARHCGRPRRTVCRSRGSWMASRHRSAARRLDRRGGGRARLPRRRVVVVAAAAGRRRASLPGDRAEPPARSRSPDREQPHARRLPRVLRPAAQTRLPAPRRQRPDLLDSRAWSSRAGRSRLCAVRVSRRRRTAGAALRSGDWTRMDRDLAPDRACGRELVRVGDGRPHRAVRVRDIHGVPRRPRRINRDGGCSRDAPGSHRVGACPAVRRRGARRVAVAAHPFCPARRRARADRRRPTTAVGRPRAPDRRLPPHTGRQRPGWFWFFYAIYGHRIRRRCGGYTRAADEHSARADRSAHRSAVRHPAVRARVSVCARRIRAAPASGATRGRGSWRSSSCPTRW